MPETTDQHDLLDRLAEEFVSRRRQGERASIEEYERQYPDLAEEIRDIFPTMLELEQLKVHKAISSGHAVRHRSLALATAPKAVGVPDSKFGIAAVIRQFCHDGSFAALSSR